jgi:hypothetical protein
MPLNTTSFLPALWGNYVDVCVSGGNPSMKYGVAVMTQ